MASLSEHYMKIQAAINAAKADGYPVAATACCCGEGLMIMNQEPVYIKDQEGKISANPAFEDKFFSLD